MDGCHMCVCGAGLLFFSFYMIYKTFQQVDEASCLRMKDIQ
jgi:hypothetical protein